jgi:shikimate dehydrogenase
LTRLGVLGWPVAHSRSPAMQNAALRAAGLEGWRYQRLPVPPEALAETVRALPALGFRGANATIPHKRAVLALAGAASTAARAIGAANTLTFDEGTIHADNTDAPALLRALGEPLPSSALVLGAGGSARAVAYALRGAGVDVAVHNRTPARAAALARDLGVRLVDAPDAAELLVNCTPVGLAPDDGLPAGAEDPGAFACVVDLPYRDGGTALAAAARAAGCRVVDGLELLVAQGALSFERWTGRPAPVAVMAVAARGPGAGS